MPAPNAKNAKRIKFSILIILLIAVFFSVYHFDLVRFVRLSEIQKLVESFGVFGSVGFVISYAVGAAIFLPATPFILAGGAIFGLIKGTILVLIGAIIGACISFAIARLLGESFVHNFLKQRFKNIDKLDEIIKDKGFGIVLILRLIPVFPFNGLNWVLGLTQVKFSHYFFGTLLGIIPSSFIYAYFGNSLAMSSVINIIVSIILFITLIVGGVLYKKYSRNSKLDKLFGKPSREEQKVIY